MAAWPQALWQQRPAALSALLGGQGSESLQQGLQQLAQGLDAAPALLVSLCGILTASGSSEPKPAPSQGEQATHGIGGVVCR